MLRGKIPHFRLTCVTQKRRCLSSLLRAFKNDRTVTLFVQGVEMALSNRGDLLIAIVLELTKSSTSACHLFEARRSVLGVRAPFESSRHSKRNEKVFNR